MTIREITAAAAGVVAFLAAFVIVTELLSPAVEFSVFLGLPAGAVVGVVVAATVLLRFRDNGDGSRALAAALVASAVVFLVALGVLLVGVGVGALAALVVAVGFGAISGTVVFLRTRERRRKKLGVGAVSRGRSASPDSAR